MKKTMLAAGLSTLLMFPMPAKAEPAHEHHDHAAMVAATGADEDLDTTQPSGSSIYWLDGTWTTDHGRAITLKSLAGKPLVLLMVYTSCKEVCPILVERMKATQKSLSSGEREKVRFVIVTFDPARDTPAAMAAYKAKVPAAKTWTFLHGDAAQVLELASVLGVRYRPVGDMFVHSNKISILNAKGEIAFQALGLDAPIPATVAAVRKALKHGK